MRCLFFDSTEADPREYNSAQFSEYFRTFIGSGVFAHTPGALLVSPGEGMQVELAAGRAFICGYMGILDQPVTLPLPGSGMHSAALRLDLGAESRSIYPVILSGGDSFPPPVREGNIYDIVLAHIEVASGLEIIVADTRDNYELCGFAAFTGQPPYQPPSDVPALIWDYTLFPDSLTAAQRDMVEGSPFYLAQYEGSRAALGFKVYAAAGEYEFTAPGTRDYIVECVGGGGGNSNVNGGGGGYGKKLVRLGKGERVSITVGARGTTDVPAGGASSFGQYLTASGGSGSGGGYAYGADLSVPGGSGGTDNAMRPGGSFLCAVGGSGVASAGPGRGQPGNTGASGQSTDGCVIVSW